MPSSTLRIVAGMACCLALAGAAGCRNLDNAQVDVLERELRQQEDYIYELEDYLISYSEKLRQCRIASNNQVENGAASALKKKTPAGEPQLMEDRPRTTRPRSLVAPPSATPPATGTLPDNGEPEPIDPKEIEIPDVEVGPAANMLRWKTNPPVASNSAVEPTPAADAPLYLPDPVDFQADLEAPPEESAMPPTAAAGEPPALVAALTAPRLTADRLHIRRIFAEPDSDAGESLDRLLVVVEALNETDEPVDAPGSASMMIMARDEAGGLAPVDRWDFTPEETAAAWQSSQLGDGLHLELPLAGRELPEGELELWVRLVDADGEKMLASTPLAPTELTSLQDAMAEQSLVAAAESPQALAAADESIKPLSASEPVKAGAPAKPAPMWRASAERLDPERVEGFASTADGKRGWTSQSLSNQPAQRTTDRRQEDPASHATADGGRWKPFR